MSTESNLDPTVNNPLSPSPSQDGGAICGRVQPETVPSRFESKPTTWVNVLGTKHVFVGIKSREDFDKIALPCREVGPNDQGHVLTKCVEADGVSVVFQHWVLQLTLEAQCADIRAKQAAQDIVERT